MQYSLCYKASHYTIYWKQFPGNCQKTELTETPNAKDPSQDDKGMTKGQNGR